MEENRNLQVFKDVIAKRSYRGALRSRVFITHSSMSVYTDTNLYSEQHHLVQLKLAYLTSPPYSTKRFVALHSSTKLASKLTYNVQIIKGCIHLRGRPSNNYLKGYFKKSPH